MNAPRKRRMSSMLTSNTLSLTPDEAVESVDAEAVVVVKGEGTSEVVVDAVVAMASVAVAIGVMAGIVEDEGAGAEAVVARSTPTTKMPSLLWEVARVQRVARTKKMKNGDHELSVRGTVPGDQSSAGLCFEYFCGPFDPILLGGSLCATVICVGEGLCKLDRSIV